MLNSILTNKIAEMSIRERCCTQAVLREWKESKPLAKRSILINCHLTHATLLLIELFINSGADLKITCARGLVCHDPIKEIIMQMGIFLSPNALADPKYRNYFDVIVDCGAYLANILTPTYGFIELTHVTPTKYKKNNSPVISVDSGIVKLLETTYGTGDGFVRAINNIYSNIGIDHRKKHYLIFGYGKVGKGICSCLYQSGVPKNLITVVENCNVKRSKAEHEGFVSLDIQNTKEIKKLLHNKVDCAVTATGVRSCISQHFNTTDFADLDYLTNMGTYDEWGPSFHKKSVLHDKKPLNFMLEYPTKIKYLDPVFAILAYATIEIIDEKILKIFTIKKPSITIEKKVLNVWMDNYTKEDQGEREIWTTDQSMYELIS